MAMKSTGRFTDDLRRLMERSYDSCHSCGSKLPREIASYAGYAAYGSPLYVGECCQRLIAELATHVYWWWETDKRCEPDTALWRYMDFAKFVALLEQRAIYFAKADRLGDTFEGAAGITDRRPQWDAFYLDFFRHAVGTAPGQKDPLSTAHVEQEAARLLGEFSTLGERDRRRTFVSCWHTNTGESEALWRLYCPPPMMGVAIRTTARLLIDALGDDPQIKLGRVQYVDFRNAFAGFHDRIYWKRKSLSHEAEVRAVVQRFDAQEDLGLVMPVDVQKLLLSVVPSPFAPGWFTSLVGATMRRFNVASMVAQSELLAEPFF
jgi:hypothetical protein